MLINRKIISESLPEIKKELIELDKKSREEYAKMQFLFDGREIPMAINKVGNKYRLTVPDFCAIIDVSGLSKDKSFLMHTLIQEYQNTKSNKRDFGFLMDCLETEVFARVPDRGIANEIRKNIRMIRPENIEAFVAKDHCHYTHAFKNSLKKNAVVVHTHCLGSKDLSDLDMATEHGLIIELPSGKYELLTPQETSKTPWKIMDARPNNKEELEEIWKNEIVEIERGFEEVKFAREKNKSSNKKILNDFYIEKKQEHELLFNNAISENNLEKIHLANIKHKWLSNFIAKKFLENLFLQTVDESLIGKFEVIAFGRIGSNNSKIAGYLSDYDINFICVDNTVKTEIETLLDNTELQEELESFGILMDISYYYTTKTEEEILSRINNDKGAIRFFCSICNSYSSLDVGKTENEMTINIFSEIAKFHPKEIIKNLYQEMIGNDSSKNSFHKIISNNLDHIGYQNKQTDDICNETTWKYSLKYQLLRFCDFINNVNSINLKKIDLTKYEKFGVLLQTILAKIYEEKYGKKDLLKNADLINDINDESFLELIKIPTYRKIVLSAIEELVEELLQESNNNELTKELNNIKLNLTNIQKNFNFDNISDEQENQIIGMGFKLFTIIHKKMIKIDELIKNHLDISEDF